MYQNSIPARILAAFKDLILVPILARINFILAGTEMIVANWT